MLARRQIERLQYKRKKVGVAHRRSVKVLQSDLIRTVLARVRLVIGHTGQCPVAAW